MSLGVLGILIYDKEIMIDAKFSICYLATTFASKADTREMEIGLSDVGKSLGRQRYGPYGCKIWLVIYIYILGIYRYIYIYSYYISILGMYIYIFVFPHLTGEGC